MKNPKEEVFLKKSVFVFVHVIKVNGVQNNPNRPHCLKLHSNGFETI